MCGVFQKLTASLILRHARRERNRTTQVSYFPSFFYCIWDSSLFSTPSSLSSFHSIETKPGGFNWLSFPFPRILLLFFTLWFSCLISLIVPFSCFFSLGVGTLIHSSFNGIKKVFFFFLIHFCIWSLWGGMK